MEKLQADNQRQAQQLKQLPDQYRAEVQKLLQPVKQELEELRSLRVWNGHPCSICGKPTSGKVSREQAAKLLREAGYGHRRCMQRQSWW